MTTTSWVCQKTEEEAAVPVEEMTGTLILLTSSSESQGLRHRMGLTESGFIEGKGQDLSLPSATAKRMMASLENTWCYSYFLLGLFSGVSQMVVEATHVNLGWGHWGSWTVVLPISDSQCYTFYFKFCLCKKYFSLKWNPGVDQIPFWCFCGALPLCTSWYLYTVEVESWHWTRDSRGDDPLRKGPWYGQGQGLWSHDVGGNSAQLRGRLLPKHRHTVWDVPRRAGSSMDQQTGSRARPQLLLAPPQCHASKLSLPGVWSHPLTNISGNLEKIWYWVRH